MQQHKGIATASLNYFDTSCQHFYLSVVDDNHYKSRDCDASQESIQPVAQT